MTSQERPMGQSRISLAVEALETREVPASNLWASALQTYEISQFLHSTMSDTSWLASSSARATVQQLFKGIYQNSQSVLHQMNASHSSGDFGGLGAMAEMNAGFAQLVGSSLNFAVATPPKPVVKPPKPPTTPTDAGMTNTLPDINDPHWVTGANGLKTWDITVGTGTPVAAGQSITVFYTGWLLNGTVFDSKRSPATPATFALSGLIQGWQQGIVGMKPGGIRRLYVPSALGYGPNGSPPTIPANADLVFEIKLVSHT
jgi:FKBP-type peptidyl-prolyl cis-trans isomerase